MFLSIFKIGKERFPSLTGFRALGAAAVFFAHLPFNTGFNLYVNVITVFFVLSGFLIVYLYYQPDPFSAYDLIKYFTNRFARLYPVYLLLVSIAIWHNHDFRPLLLFKNYTLTHALFHNQADVLIGPSWTLTVEECFYMLAPIIMLLVRRYNYFVSFLFGVLLLLAALLVSLAPISFLHTPIFVMTTTFFGYIFEFYAGVWLAFHIIKLEKKGSIKTKGIAFTVWGILGTFLCLGAQVFLYNYNGALNFPALIVLNNFVFAIPVTVLYYGLICEDTVLSGLLSGKFFSVLGRTTYTFYIVHMMVVNYIAIPYLLRYFNGHYNLFVVASFLLTQLIAMLIFILYEEPLNVLIRKKVRIWIRPLAKQRE